MRSFLKLLLFSILFTFSSQAQILDKIKKIKNTISENIIDKLSKDPITTSFKDVNKKKYFENTFGDDAVYTSFFLQSYNESEGFKLQPGFYEGTFQSFCIKAGTYSPVKGRGRFYAPIKGPKADIISDIIGGYQRNPDLTQREVQLLLWAIIAKTDFLKMKGPVKVTATKLLSSSQIARLSKGALDKLANNELKKIAETPPALRAVLEAENNLRNKYYSGVRSYQEYEKIAMLAGVEPIVSGYESGRWTKHPDGFFIRYFPQGYQRTRTQVYVPETIEAVTFNPANDIAVPAESGQRLLQTGLSSGNPNSNTGGNSNSNVDSFCEPAFNAAADKAIREQMIMQNIPGLAIAVYQNGKMVHLKAYGYNNIYEKQPIKLDSRMKWASISKSVTGVAAAQLEERKINGFKTNTLVTDYIENWDSVSYTDTLGETNGIDKRHLDVKVDQLLNNTSGIQQYRKGSRKDENKHYTLIIKDSDTTVVEFIETKEAYGYNDLSPRKFKPYEAVEVFNKSVLDFEPGAKYLYSSYGFVLAGAVIENVAPNGYRDWVEQNIINAANLKTMKVCEEAKPGHSMAKDGMLEAYNSNCQEYTIPAGGYESNICDLAKYAFALSTGAYFEKKKDILWNNSVAVNLDTNDASRGYSYGLHFKGNGSDLNVWHGGHGGNVRSHMHFFPTDSTGIVIIAPAVYADLPELSRFVFQALNIRPSLYNNVKNTPIDKCRRGMKNGEDLFHGVWRKTQEDVLVRTGIEKSGFFEEMKRLKEYGYEVVDIETFTNDNKRYWDAVLKENTSNSKLVSGLTLSKLKSEIQKMKSNGYIVIDIESYIAGNKGRRWGAVFSKKRPKNKASFKMSSEEFLNEHHRNNALGYKLVDIESYPTGNQINWTGVWVAGSDTDLEINLESSELFARLKEKRNQGFRIADVEYYMIDNQEWRVAVVWEKGLGDEFITGEIEDLDGDGEDDDEDRLVFQNFCDHMNTHHNKMKGYELIDWERIDIEWK